MTTEQSVDGDTSSISTTFFPQLRRSRRGSIASLSSTALVGKESLADTLDQIHSTASQSDTLTTFNAYTSPPASSAGSEGRGITSELQGGLSGLYSRLRASVGNVKDIVTTIGDEITEDYASTNSPRFTAPSTTPTRQRLERVKSSNNSVLSGKDGTNSAADRNFSQDRVSAEANAQERAAKQRPTNLSTGAIGVSSRGSSASGIALRSPVTLPVVAAAASPAVAEVNVNAVKDREFIDESSEKEKKDSKTPLRTYPESRTVEGKLSDSAAQQRAGHDTSSNGQHPEPSIAPSIGSQLGTDGSAPLATTKRPEKPAGNRHNLLASQGIIPGPSQEPSYHGVLSKIETNEALETPKVSNKPPTSEVSSEKMKDASTDEAPLPGNVGRRTTQNESRKGSRQDQKYQHVEIPLLKPMPAPISSRSRAPAVSLTRASSDATATTSISNSKLSASAHEQSHESSQSYTRRAHSRDVKSRNAVLPHTRSKLLNREYWMRDENAKDCFYCGDPFSTFRRKHHCSK